MHLLLNRLSTAWLVLALIVAPIQAMALPAALLPGNGCPMMFDDQPSPNTVHKPGTHTAADQGAPHCPHCVDVDHGCDDGCAGNGCFSVHLQLSLPGSLLVFAGEPALGAYRDCNDSPASLTPPPLLRPPVV